MNRTKKYDFNTLEQRAHELICNEKYEDALRIYFYMADGDPSLDAGYLGEKIAICYEKLGEVYAAKYWYGRAAEENPEVRLSAAAAYERLGKIVTIDDLLS